MCLHGIVSVSVQVRTEAVSRQSAFGSVKVLGKGRSAKVVGKCICKSSFHTLVISAPRRGLKGPFFTESTVRTFGKGTFIQVPLPIYLTRIFTDPYSVRVRTLTIGKRCANRCELPVKCVSLPTFRASSVSTRNPDQPLTAILHDR